MATTNLYLKGKKIPSAIYLRFGEGKAIDIWAKTGLSIDPKFWDKKRQKIREVIDVPSRDELNSKLAKLQIYIVDEYNVAYGNGMTIDKTWLDGVISKFFNRPKDEGKHKIEPFKIYFTDFALWWLKEKAPKYKVSANKYMDDVTINQYNQLVDNVLKFEGSKKIKFKDITSDFMDNLTSFLTDKENYSEQTVKRKIARFKFFCQRAEELNIEVNNNYKVRVFVESKEQEYKEPYLNEDEINKIFKHDFSYNKTLEDVRDNFIIGLRTGLRISDFLTRLNLSNFLEDDIIEIKTKKTGHSVAIPLHWQVKAILNKRAGLLPPKISEPHFNKFIKIICQVVEIDNEMIGGVPIVDEKTKIKRKVVGTYKKYELISSHVCRRSFATNHFGKVPNKVLMDICGWKKEDMLLKYIKATNRESAMVMKQHWEKTAQ